MTKDNAIKLALEGAANYIDTLGGDSRKYRQALAEQPAQQCKWPTCQREDYQQALAEQIKRELVGEQPAQREPEQGDIFCGVDFTDGMLSVSVLRRRADDVAELLHAEQIELPAQPQPAGLLQEIARLHDRIKELEKDVEFLSLPAQQEPVAQWQLRHHLHTDGVWENCTDYAASLLQKEATFEIRRLYTSPQPAQQEQEQEQEPVAPKCGAIIEVFGKDWRLEYMSLPVGKHKLYTQQYNYTVPAKRTPLTVEEVKKLIHPIVMADLSDEMTDFEIVRAIEAAHNIKEKNT